MAATPQHDRVPKRAGIRAVRSVPLRLSAEHALLLERFDRSGATRLHAISAGTALRAVAADAARPELGYGALAEILRRSGDLAASGRDAAELFRRMVFNVLVDNTDDHEKNHALLAPASNRLALSPAYDVVPTLAGQACTNSTWATTDASERSRTRCRNARASGYRATLRPPRPPRSSRWSISGRRTSRRSV